MVSRAKSGPGSEEVADILRRQIRAGHLRPGEPLPSLPTLQESFGASPNVVRYAVKQLTTERLVETRPGKGNFVTDPSEWTSNEAAALMQLVEALRGEVREIRDESRRRFEAIERRLK